ncbi:hypothetical protein DY000_02054496, partial [Brassica cretica]
SFKWTLEKRTEEADNLVRYINNLCVKNQCNGFKVIDIRLVVRQYCGFEEIEHVDSLFTVVTHLYAFALSDYVPWLRFLDLEGHEKVVSGAMRNISKYNDPFVDQRLKKWRNGKMKEPRDFLDMFILAKDTDGKPALSDEEIKAQVTISSQSMSNLKLEMITATTDGEMRRASDIATKLRAAE